MCHPDVQTWSVSSVFRVSEWINDQPGHLPFIKWTVCGEQNHTCTCFMMAVKPCRAPTLWILSHSYIIWRRLKLEQRPQTSESGCWRLINLILTELSEHRPESRVVLSPVSCDVSRWLTPPYDSVSWPRNSDTSAMLSRPAESRQTDRQTDRHLQLI